MEKNQYKCAFCNKKVTNVGPTTKKCSKRENNVCYGYLNE